MSEVLTTINSVVIDEHNLLRTIRLLKYSIGALSVEHSRVSWQGHILRGSVWSTRHYSCHILRLYLCVYVYVCVCVCVCAKVFVHVQ